MIRSRILVLAVLCVMTSMLHAQTPDSQSRDGRVVYDTLFVHDTLHVRDTINIGEYIRSQTFEQLFSGSEYTDIQSLPDSLKTKFEEAVTFSEKLVLNNRDQNDLSMDSIKKIISAALVMLVMGGCSLMYGYKPIKQFDKNEYEAVVASVMDDNFKMNSIISDSAQFAFYRMILSDSLWQHKTSAQPVQILYFKGDKLVSYHINCTAQGGLTGLNWNTDHRFETFPPASAMPITPSMCSLSEIRNIYHITDNNEYLIVVFWSNMLSKISKSAIETVKSNLSKYGNVDQASIVLINTDKYYVSLQE